MTKHDSQGRFIFLGTSTSVGVPVIGCDCPTCLSNDPRDTRTRASAYLEGPWGRILIDSGPDLREQALREKITEVDAVLYTHEHLDHVVGFDELRAFCWRRKDPLPLHGSPETLATLEKMFPWAFNVADQNPGYIRPEPRAFSGSFEISGLQITPIEVEHGSVRTFGFRFDHPVIGSLAYLPDVKRIPPQSLELLSGVKTLVIDALREEEHSTHLTIAEALAISKSLQPRRTFLTHLSHEIRYVSAAAALPAEVSLAYDGFSVQFA